VAKESYRGQSRMTIDPEVLSKKNAIFFLKTFLRIIFFVYISSESYVI